MGKGKPAPHVAINRASAELRQLETFVNICIRALDASTRLNKIIEARQNIAKDANLTEHILSMEELKREKNRAVEVEKFAQQQKSEGFSYLFSLAAVRLWTILEAVVDDLVVDFMNRPEKCKNKEVIFSLKGPLLEFSAASSERKAEFLTERLKDSVNAGLKRGIGRFEAILEPIGLGGGVDEGVKRVLFELSQVRNSIVHKAGIVDQRFMEDCPWLNLERRKPLKINANDFHLYMVSAYFYLIELSYRIYKLQGYEKPKDLIELQQKTANNVKQIWSERNDNLKQFKEEFQ